MPFDGDKTDVNALVKYVQSLEPAAERVMVLESALIETARYIALGRAGKIHAIRAYRAATGSGLKESKEWVEMFPSTPSADYSRIQRLEDRVSLLEQGKTP